LFGLCFLFKCTVYKFRVLKVKEIHVHTTKQENRKVKSAEATLKETINSILSQDDTLMTV